MYSRSVLLVLALSSTLVSASHHHARRAHVRQPNEKRDDSILSSLVAEMETFITPDCTASCTALTTAITTCEASTDYTCICGSTFLAAVNQCGTCIGASPNVSSDVAQEGLLDASSYADYCSTSTPSGAVTFVDATAVQAGATTLADPNAGYSLLSAAVPSGTDAVYTDGVTEIDGTPISSTAAYNPATATGASLSVLTGTATGTATATTTAGGRSATTAKTVSGLTSAATRAVESSSTASSASASASKKASAGEKVASSWTVIALGVVGAVLAA